MDTIHIRGLKLEATIGVHAWEQKLPRTLVVDLDLAADTARAARSDQLSDTADYAAVAAAATLLGKESRFNLVETFAERLAERLQRDFQLAWLRVTVHKPGAVPAAQDVSVTIERGTRS